MTIAAGWIYALTSPSLPGVIKIGRTTRDPVTRARELGGYAGATADYVVIAHAAVADAVACETHAHRMLKHCRRKGTELFDVSPGRARAVIFAVARSTYAARRFSPSRRGFRRRFTRRRLRIRYRKLWAVGLVGSALLYYVLGFHHL
jgi:T5orf172 domain